MKSPIEVHLKVTNCCNLNCIHCCSNSGNLMDRELSAAKIKKLVDQLADIGVLEVGVSGGEPFLRSDLFEILSYMRDKEIKVKLNTNGTFIDKKTCEKLLQNGISRIMISLDGARSETHDVIRGRNGAFKKTIEGIETAVHSGMNVMVRTTVLKNNIAEVLKIIKLLKYIGIKRYGIVPVLALGRAKSIMNTISLTVDEWHSLLGEVIFQAQKENKEFDIIDTFNFFHFDNKELPQSRIAKYLVGCKAAKTQCSILPNGDVIPCSLFNYPEFVAGNIRETHFSEIWNKSPIFDQFRDITPNTLEEKCSQCKFRLSCAGGCRAFTYQQYKVLNNADPRCPWVRGYT